jgi:hypothetical protein
MEVVGDLLAAPTTARADHPFYTVRPFRQALVQNTSAFQEVSTISYMTSCISSTRCWRCNQTLYVLSWPPNNTLSKRIKSGPCKCMLTPLPKHKRRVERPITQADRPKSRPMSTAAKALVWLSVGYRQTLFLRASSTITLASSPRPSPIPMAHKMDREPIPPHRL